MINSTNIFLETNGNYRNLEEGKKSSNTQNERKTNVNHLL